MEREELDAYSVLKQARAVKEKILPAGSAGSQSKRDRERRHFGSQNFVNKSLLFLLLIIFKYIKRILTKFSTISNCN